MICYKCQAPIPDGEPHYNGHDKSVCKPCFNDSRRCFVCRFPGMDLQNVAGLGLECEFCRGSLVAEGADLKPLFPPLIAFLKTYGIQPPEPFRFVWDDLKSLREMQTDADLPPAEFIDDFLRHAYPVYYRDGRYHLLRRMTRETFVVYMIIQMAVADLAVRYGQQDLSKRNPFHTFARGFSHWLGYEAAARLGYDLERRQLRKWPELGGMGEFERWQRMAEVNPPAKVLGFFRASLGPLSRKYLEPLPPG